MFFFFCCITFIRISIACCAPLTLARVIEVEVEQPTFIDAGVVGMEYPLRRVDDAPSPVDPEDISKVFFFCLATPCVVFFPPGFFSIYLR